MECTYYLFPIPEIEHIILSYLDPLVDYQQLVSVNKYLYELIDNDKTYTDLKNFCKQQHAMKFCITLDKIHKYFIIVCRYGFLYVAKYLLVTYQNKIDIHVVNEFAFQLSCKMGHLELAQWLYELDRKTDIHAENELAFKWSCENGHLEVAQWLYGLDHKINIHADNKLAFQWSCANGHLEVAQWLHGLDNKINIHADNESAFRYSCENGHLETAQWLASLTDRYKLQIEDHKIVKWKIHAKVAKN